MKRLIPLCLIVFCALASSLPLIAQVQSPSYKDGSYSLDYKDEELGSVSVTVLVKDGKLASVEFPKGLGDLAIEPAALKQYVAGMISAPDFMTVDAVSGATQSCDLVKYAVQNALKQAVKK